MKARHVIAVLTVAGATAEAGAQVSAIYSIAFGSPNGPNTTTLAVGETVHVFAKITHSSAAPNPIMGFADAEFSITGTSVAGGAGTWGVNTNTASPNYSLPHPWGGQVFGMPGVSVGIPSGNRLNDVIWAYGFLLTTVHPFPQNPANVWRGTFTASVEGGVSVAFTALEVTHVFVGYSSLPTPVPAWSLPGAGGSITIVPAPAGLALLGLGGVAALRRGRASIQEVQA